MEKEKLMMKSTHQKGAPMSVRAVPEYLADRPIVFVSNEDTTMTQRQDFPLSYTSRALNPSAKVTVIPKGFPSKAIHGKASQRKKRPPFRSSFGGENGIPSDKEPFHHGSESPKTISSSRSRPKINVQAYKAVHRNGFVFHIQQEARFQIFGYAKLTVLYGTIRIFGCELSCTSAIKSINLSGAADLKSFVVEAITADSPNVEELKTDFKAQNIIVEDSSTLFMSLKPGDAVIFVEKVNVPSVFNAKCYLPPSSLPKIEQLHSALPVIIQSVTCAVDHMESRYYSPYLMPPDWNSLPLFGRTIIVGGKGLGKTTLAKCLVNKLLNIHGSVLWLDFDPGQGEFIPPGSVGYNVLTKPVFGPNYSHCTEPDRTIHLGNVDVNRCSTEYVASVRLLVELALEDFGSIPWLVNTMGYTKGLGLYLNKAVIQAVSPDHVIQVTGPSSKNNFRSRLTPEEVNRKDISMFPWSSNRVVNFNLITLSSSCPSSVNRTGKNDRNLMLLSYLSRMLTAPLYYFHCVTPYSIPLSSLYIGISSQIMPQDILSALNGSLVNLTALTPSKFDGFDRLEVEQPQGSWFRVIFNPPVLLSIGLGIVRGIDTLAKELYLITPVTQHKLADVNMLTISAVTLPPELFLNQEGVEDETNYWDEAESSWSEDEEDEETLDSLTSEEDIQEIAAEFDRSVQDGTVRLINEFADMLNSDNHRDNVPPEETNFDVSLAAKHEYLGNEMEELSGRTLHDEGSIIWLPIVFELGIILIPGQTLPLSVSNTANVTMLREVITKDKTFGIVCMHNRHVGGHHHVGTTAEIFEFQESWRGTGVNIKAKGRQRFRLLEQKYQMSGLTYGKVQILPEIRLSPLPESRITSLDRYRKNDSFLAKNGRLDISSSVWPRWVYSQYDAKILADKVISELTTLKYIVASTIVPRDALNLSYWVAQCLPFDDSQRIAMLNMNTAEERLQFALQHIDECSTVYCRFCGIQVASRLDIFSMSVEGPQGAYCNPGGHVHEILTVYRATLSLMRQSPSTEFSWFPGYGWTIANCTRCGRHMGWLFTAMKPSLSPSKFWGLTKRSVTMSSDRDRPDPAMALREFFENAYAYP